MDFPQSLVPTLCPGSTRTHLFDPWVLQPATSSAKTLGPCSTKFGCPDPTKPRGTQPCMTGTDTHSCCLSMLSVKPHLGKGKVRQWGRTTQCSTVQGLCAPQPGFSHLRRWWLQLLPNAHVNLGYVQWPLTFRLSTLGTESPADPCGHPSATTVPKVPLPTFLSPSCPFRTLFSLSSSSCRSRMTK